MPRRAPTIAALAALASVAIANPLSVDAEGGHVAPPAAPAAATRVPSPAEAYAATRRRGQPVAVLTRATVLRAAPGGRRLARLRRRTEFGSPRVLAAVGERRGWLEVKAPQVPNRRTGWIPAGAAALVASPWSVRADLSRRVVEVERDGRVVRRFPVAIGKPSTPTPTGRFAVTDKLQIAGGSSAYGCCVLALSGHQPHVEPGWSGGNRLAIHGTTDPGSIGSAASFGCLRAREDDVRWLTRHVFLGSIVSIRR